MTKKRYLKFSQLRFRSEFLPKEQCPKVLLLYIILLHDINDISSFMCAFLWLTYHVQFFHIMFNMFNKQDCKNSNTIKILLIPRAQFFKSNPVGFGITDWIKSWKWVFQKQKRDSERRSEHVIQSYI